MSSFKITGVRTEKTADDEHEHITAVQVNDNTIFSRSTVIADLRSSSGDRYYTYAGGKIADVIVVTCPYCSYRDYITTEPDYTTANNLLSLPRV
jgi:hypothetical protein